MRLSCIFTEIFGPKYIGVTTLTFWGHVTSSITLPFDLAYVVFYWWSIVTMRLSRTVTEIYSLKFAFAHVKGQKFTAHALCHVTYRHDGQNDHIFKIPMSIFPIHYTTFMRLRWRLRVVCRWQFYTQACFSMPKLRMPRVTWPVGRVSKITTYLKFPRPYCLFTIQLLWAYDDD